MAILRMLWFMYDYITHVRNYVWLYYATVLPLLHILHSSCAEIELQPTYLKCELNDIYTIIFMTKTHIALRIREG